MKKFALFALAGLCFAFNASAASISLAVNFGDSLTPTAMSGIGGTGDTQVTLDSLTYALTCTGVDAALCGPGGFGTATFQSTTLDSTVAQDISLGADLIFRMDTGWSILRIGQSALIQMTGTFSLLSDPSSDTGGFINFSMPTVTGGSEETGCEIILNEFNQNVIYAPGCSTFNASGATNSPVPEPGSFALMGLGLAGVGLIARRRMNR